MPEGEQGDVMATTTWHKELAAGVQRKGTIRSKQETLNPCHRVSHLNDTEKVYSKIPFCFDVRSPRVSSCLSASDGSYFTVTCSLLIQFSTCCFSSLAVIPSLWIPVPCAEKNFFPLLVTATS